jgi:hypothetical protein
MADIPARIPASQLLKDFIKVHELSVFIESPLFTVNELGCLVIAE